MVSAGEPDESNDPRVVATKGIVAFLVRQPPHVVQFFVVLGALIVLGGYEIWAQNHNWQEFRAEIALSRADVALQRIHDKEEGVAIRATMDLNHRQEMDRLDAFRDQFFQRISQKTNIGYDGTPIVRDIANKILEQKVNANGLHNGGMRDTGSASDSLAGASNRDPSSADSEGSGEADDGGLP